MKERAIRLNDEEVRAVRAGRRTQKRFVVTLPKGCRWCDELGGEPEGWYTDGHGAWNILTQPCRYGAAGDRLWVKETFFIHRGFVEYRASWLPDRVHQASWRPSVHMPRWASRITLEIVSTRVERLQEISEADSYAEGVTIPPEHAFASNGNPEMRNEARVAYQQLWTSINRPESWAANPWVDVVEFTMVTE